MQPQDVFNRGFDAAIASLDRWLDSIKDVAHIDREETAQYWRVRVEPRCPNTCPAELMVSRHQTFDLDIASECIVDQPASDLTFFQTLLEAVCDGRVVSRIWSAQATGAELTREVIVDLPDGRAWSTRRLISAGTAATDLSAVASDRVFVAYRRD